ncbi:MAG: helicase HerA-like domain-containing protein [Pseudomonadota bacterium]
MFLGGGGAGDDRGAPQTLALKFANRHGLIAGATGTGKTVSLQIMAEAFSDAGVPVVLADVKGDLSGLARPGSPDHKLHDKLMERAQTIGFDGYAYRQYPVVFWDLFGEQGHPVRATVADLGPLTLSRLLGLNEAQEGALNVVFRAAEDQGLPIYDLKDLRAMLAETTKKSGALSAQYGNVSTASIGAIQRRLLVLENQGAGLFFGEPALKLEDLLRRDADGRGQVNVLAADRLMRSPRLYAMFLFWMMNKLFEELPEVGDPDRPKLAFFFDEAHLLFDDAPKAFVDKVEQVARLIRSKGVGVYFVTQNPADLPEDVLGQLGNRVQHALRAYTPRERKALKLAAETFRANPTFDTADAITQLGVGEALVSTLEGKGAPSVVARTLMRPPSSRLGPITAAERAETLAASPLAGVYDRAVDRESAFELLEAAAERAAETAARELAEKERREEEERRRKEMERRDRVGRSRSRGSRRQSAGEAMLKSAARRIGSKLGDTILKRVMRSIFGR